MAISRRSFLTASAVLAASLPINTSIPRAEGNARLHLRPGSGTATFFGDNGPKTSVWCYNDVVPGPEIRAPQGSRINIVVENALDQDTTVHWHGLRIPHAMDGVPDLTQPPIGPGERFEYSFELPDAGTFWYHPHVRGSEQQGRGLYGAFIVEEPEPPTVDREVVWIIDDWRLTEDGAIMENFHHPMDLSHAGRLGNVATLNGKDSQSFSARAGERIRLRLINVANARIFALRFKGHRPYVIALDGHPTTPHEPTDGLVILPPGARVDLIVDMEGVPGSRHAVNDVFYPQQNFRFLEIRYSDERPLRGSPLNASMFLPANPLAEPDLAEAATHEIILAGGAMGGMQGAILDGKSLTIRDLAQRGKVWAINGIVAHKTDMAPLLTFQEGRTQILRIRNDTAFPHPMHLHGHAFRLLARNGEPHPHRPFLDTVLLGPDDTAEVGFVADNPGDWLFHCHILEHMEAGMSAVFRVG